MITTERLCKDISRSGLAPLVEVVEAEDALEVDDAVMLGITLVD